ncbi:MAG: SDR family NAD(P)-dependent oxidoreductase, partial [Mycobacteriaceae bacterium]
RLGAVDVLVNCAGISLPNPLRDLDPTVYHRTLAVNLHAPVMLMRAFGSSMARRGYGRIVNVTSVHAQVTEPGSLAYDISKAGLESATRTAAVELAGQGVLVNAVAPGFVATQMAITDGRNELESPEFLSVYIDRARLPAQRAAAPEEVAHAIAWLASSANTYTTGQRLTVDGGLTARF